MTQNRAPPQLAGPRHAPAEWVVQRERGSPRLLRLMVFLSLRLGRALSRYLLHCVTLYFFLFAPDVRRESRRYLEVALRRAPDARDRFRHLQFFASCVHDRIYLLNDRYRDFEFSVEGEELMRAQFDSRQGAFLMGAHVGSFEALRSFGQQQPLLRVTMAMYERNARKINAILAAVNPRAQLDIIGLGELDTMLHLAARLDQGAFVGMLADRTLADEPVQSVMLLGRLAHLPTGPMRVAAALRRSVIFMLGLYRGGNRYHVVFARIADFSTVTRENRAAAVHAAIERYAELLERYCRSDPYNWFNFFDFWPPVGNPVGSPAGTPPGGREP